MKDDRAIVRNILAGDADAYAELVQRYYPALFGFLCKMGLRTRDSWELSEKILSKIYSDLACYDSRREFETWLYRTAASSLREYFKNKRRDLLITVGDIPEFLRAPNQEPDRTPEMESLNSLLAPLNIDARIMLVLHYNNRLPLREIGSIYGLSSDSVRMRLYRARAIILRGADHAGSRTKCRYNEEFIVKLLSDDIGPAEKQAFENHLKACAECSRQMEADSSLIKRMRKDLPAVDVPVESIMNRIDKNAYKNRKLGFKEFFATMDNLMKLWRVAVPAVIAGLLIMMLVVPDFFLPVWGSVMSIFDKPEEPVGVADVIEEPEPADPPVLFTPAPALASGSELIEKLNAGEMGEPSWQVLYAGQNRIFIRNSGILAVFRDGAISMAADLQALGLNHTKGPVVTEFSFPATGDYFVAGNSVYEEGAPNADTGVYLFNARDGGYLKISDTGFNQTAFAWSPNGYYLAFASKEEGVGISILNLRTLRLSRTPEHGTTVKRLYVSNNGDVAAFTGDLVMASSPDRGGWTSETVQYDPFYIDCETKSVWYVMNGSITKHVMGSDTDTVMDIDSAAATRDRSEAYITSCRVTGNYMVFRLKNGDAGIMNLRTSDIKYLNMDNEIKGDLLPWCDVTPQGTRLMFDNDGKFLVLSGRDIVTVNIPGFADLTPVNTRWMDDEHIVYVRMLDEESPRAGEFSIYAISVFTGEIIEIFRSVDKEPVLNTPEPGKSDSLTTRPSGSEKSNEIFETDKATGRRIESIVKNGCTAKRGPGDNYEDIGSVAANEIIIYNSRIVNGWCLAQKVSGMLDYYDMRNVFWIKAENICLYDRNSLKAGIVTANSVNLSRTTLKKGNLLRVIISEEDRSYVISEAMELIPGITGWVDNASFTQDFTGVYFSQAYLKRGSPAYSEPYEGSDPADDFMQHMANAGSDVFVNLGSEPENGFVYATLASGASGWVSEQDIYLPGSGGQPAAPGTGNPDLDGDGAGDATSFVTDGTSYTLTVNGCSAYGTGNGVRSEIRLADIDAGDGSYEIVVEEYGDGGEYSSLFYHYDGQSLSLMGRLPGLCDSSITVRGDGTVLAKARGPVLDAWFYWQEYRLTGQHMLEATPKLFYEKIGYKESEPLKLKVEELSFTDGPGEAGITFVLRKDEKVRFIGCDGGGWCLFENMEGKWGWLEINGFTDIPLAGASVEDVFEGLNR